MKFIKKRIAVLISIILVVGIFTIFLIYRNSVHSADIEVLNGQLDKENQYDDQNNIDNEETNDDSLHQTPNANINELDNSFKIIAQGNYEHNLVEENSTNILIIGEDKKNGLYDTIGIVNVDDKNQKVKIIMIPRDTYIEYTPEILGVLDQNGKLHQPGVLKINYSHYIGGMINYDGKFKSHSISFLADVIKEKFGIEINDYIKVNVEGFIEIVDLFGGVDINVPYGMNYEDPYQDLYIHLDKGVQHLNGKQAEGFVRYRQGYNEKGVFCEYGDIERKKNQMAFLKAFIDQHGNISNINKIPGLMKTLSKNVKHSIALNEILLKYTSMAKDIAVKKYNIESTALNGEVKRIDGSSYLVIGDNE